MTVHVPIYQRSRKYGYIYWQKSLDEKMSRFFDGLKQVDVTFQRSEIGKKKIDFVHRRLSVGWARTRALGQEVSIFRLTLRDNGRLLVTCE